jgi:hypothetical protein
MYIVYIDIFEISTVIAEFHIEIYFYMCIQMITSLHTRAVFLLLFLTYLKYFWMFHVYKNSIHLYLFLTQCFLTNSVGVSRRWSVPMAARSKS